MSGPPPISWIVGVDPGFEGGIGIISDTTGQCWRVYDMPTYGKGRKRMVDGAAVARILGRNPDQIDRVVIEEVTTRPGEAPEASRRFGEGVGTVVGVCAALDIPVERVTPAKWKGALGLDGKDTGADWRAQVLRTVVEMTGVPAEQLKGPRGGLKDGRAEALLIANWAWGRTMKGLRNMDPDTRLTRVLFGGGKGRRKRGSRHPF